MAPNQSVLNDCDLATSTSMSKHQDAALDEALLETFPASDPIALDFSFTRCIKKVQEQPSLQFVLV